ncbi:MAG: flagellar basal body P-ring formation chaperone FlgA [Gammaproteobacteria bacterium]|nr:flagellar basal body P-ring formation chaperone FlgA [Gammaproteobacteria bacterium]
MNPITVKFSPLDIKSCIGWLRVTLFASVLFHSPNIFAVNQTLSLEIESEIIKFIQKNSRLSATNLEIEVNTLDQNLQLKPCDKKIEVAYAGKQNNTGRVLLKVHCSGPHRWKIYLSAKIDYKVKALMTRRSLPKNSILTAKDINITEQKLSNLPRGYYSSLNELNGLQTKRTLRKNQIISPYQLTKQDLIKSGDTILLIAQRAGIRVSMQGRALNKGANGDKIRVKNSSSGRIIEATVIRNGVASVVY